MTPSKIINKGEISYIILLNKKGEEKCRVIIDREDFDIVSKFRWQIKGGYARTDKMIKGKLKWIWLHHLFMPRKIGLEIDHINRNRLDNRKSNLRYLTHAQNGRNNPRNGVSFRKDTKRWTAYTNVNKKRHRLGCFDSFEEAKKVRDNFIIKTLYV